MSNPVLENKRKLPQMWVCAYVMSQNDRDYSKFPTRRIPTRVPFEIFGDQEVVHRGAELEGKTPVGVRNIDNGAALAVAA